MVNLKNDKADVTYVNNRIDAIIGTGAGETLDTIGEIAQALRNNADVVDTLATKSEVDKIENTINSLNLYDYTFSSNAYVEDGVLYLDSNSAFVVSDTLVLRKGDVKNGTLYL